MIPLVREDRSKAMRVLRAIAMILAASIPFAIVALVTHIGWQNSGAATGVTVLVVGSIGAGYYTWRSEGRQR